MRFVLLAILATACTLPDYENDNDHSVDPTVVGGTSSSLDLQELDPTGGADGWIAVGGSARFDTGTLPTGAQVGGPFAVALEHAGTARVTALAAGAGTLTVSLGTETRSLDLHAATVDHVAVTATSYALDHRSPIAFDVAGPPATIELIDLAGDPLADTSLDLLNGTDTGVSQYAWNRIVADTAGAHALVIGGGSLPATTLSIAFAGDVDRVTAVVGAPHVACFHAYAGDVEVVTTWTFDVESYEADANCASANASTGTVTGTTHGLSSTAHP
jgi:hypothetical protein